MKIKKLQKKQKYTLLIIAEIVLILISEILNKKWQVSQIEFVNNIGLVVLVMPIWYLLFILRRESMNSFLKLCVYFLLTCFSVAILASVLIMLTEHK